MFTSNLQCPARKASATRKLAAACLAGALAWCGASHASVIYAPVSVSLGAGTTPLGGNCFDPNHLIDQSGLSTGYTSGVTPFAVATSATHQQNTCNTGAGAGTLSVFTFSMGNASSVLMDGLALWPVNAAPGQFFGTQDFLSLYADNDGVYSGNEQLVGGAVLNHPVTAPLAAAAVVNFGPVAASYFHLVGFNSEAGFLRIGEVAFRGEAVPEPGTTALLAAALLAAGLTTRRGRRLAAPHEDTARAHPAVPGA